MTPDTMHTLARCKSLALGAMISAGGKPAWVATAGPAAPPPPRPSRSSAEPAGPVNALGFTAREQQKLSALSPKVHAALAKLLSHLDSPASKSTPHACCAGTYPDGAGV
jgi:hypothetical protein